MPSQDPRALQPGTPAATMRPASVAPQSAPADTGPAAFIAIDDEDHVAGIPIIAVPLHLENKLRNTPRLAAAAKQQERDNYASGTRSGDSSFVAEQRRASPRRLSLSPKKAGSATTDGPAARAVPRSAASVPPPLPPPYVEPSSDTTCEVTESEDCDGSVQLQPQQRFAPPPGSSLAHLASELLTPFPDGPAADDKFIPYFGLNSAHRVAQSAPSADPLDQSATDYNSTVLEGATSSFYRGDNAMELQFRAADKSKTVRNWNSMTIVCTCGAAACYERERVHLYQLRKDLKAREVGFFGIGGCWENDSSPVILRNSW